MRPVDQFSAQSCPSAQGPDVYFKFKESQQFPESGRCPDGTS